MERFLRVKLKGCLSSVTTKPKFFLLGFASQILCQVPFGGTAASCLRGSTWEGEGHSTLSCTSQSDHRCYTLRLIEEACMKGREVPEPALVTAGGTVGAGQASCRWVFNTDIVTHPTLWPVLSMEAGWEDWIVHLLLPIKGPLCGKRSFTSITFWSVCLKIYRCPFISS